VVVTRLLKAMLDFVASQSVWVVIAVPLAGLALAAWILRWGAFPSGTIPADITGDVVETAGEEEHFPWRRAPIRLAAVFATVGLGQAMGTEAPAAYFGEAAGACLCDRGERWRRFLRPAAVAGGAAGVAAVMGIGVVGSAYMLELGRRHKAPLSLERLTAALIGGFVGRTISVVFHFHFIRLITPKVPPTDIAHATITALCIGALSGALTSFAGSAIYRAKKWTASPGARLAWGVLAAGFAAATLAAIAAPSAAVGPGGGAILWAESRHAFPLTLLAVAILRAAATTAAAAAGGCGGIFVPFLAVGDIGGRVFAPGLGLSDDLAGAAGAAAGISGGYRLPVTAAAMVLALGGPRTAMLTCLATVAVAYLAGAWAGSVFDRIARKGSEA
jgi:H+/Cl- antiporter ClcA